VEQKTAWDFFKKPTAPSFLLLRLATAGSGDCRGNFFPRMSAQSHNLREREVPKFRQNCRDFPVAKKVAEGPKTLIQVGEHTVASALQFGAFFETVFSCLTRTLGK